MRDGVEDFGMTIRPRSRCQRSTTWAGVLPCFFAMASISGFFSPAPWPRGLHDSVTIPLSSWNLRSSACWKVGCNSIWFTAGTTPVASMIASRLARVKLDTPIDLARPASRKPIMAFQVAMKSLDWTGQWMR